jgi:hypothetical protein
MIILVILAVTTLAAAIGLGLYQIARSSVAVQDKGDLKLLIEPLDVLAFANLMDPREEDFLRENLSASVFRKIQRLRIRAAIDYVRCAARNAAILIKVGRLAGVELSMESSQQADEMVTAAVQLRLLSFLVLCLLCVKIAFPGLRLSLAGVSTLHERLVGQLGSLTRPKPIAA